ncbi:MAG: cardiolipin synthase [Desulfobacterales bacterium S3730MH5]|nr:MAG: cardiolipin synthase [Desulfobacterales bacterium S3730MH5]
MPNSLIVFIHAVIIIGFTIRVIMMRRPVGVTLAWLILIFALPLAGAIMYLLVGERHLGRQRVAREAALRVHYGQWLQKLPRNAVADCSSLNRKSVPLKRLLEGALGIPALAGNRLHLMDVTETTLRSIIADIDRAKHTCHMEFYIWNEGGTADEVCEAMIRAAKRGAICRVLVDAIGSSGFLKSNLVRRLRNKGIEVVAALPVGPVRMFFVRLDLRLHRKIVVIDGEIAYTGSLNLVDPRYFKQTAGVGQWVDAMVRIEGPAVQALGALFLWDWVVETGQDIKALMETRNLKTAPQVGSANVQTVPSGPGSTSDTTHQLLLASIYAAHSELIMTTPYFVPDESLLTALLSATKRGVNVTIILPEKIDSLLVRYACRSYFDDLLTAGVRIICFQGGLLHTKSITVDGEIALFGTVNLDPRSFWLDFEVTLSVYDPDFGARLRALQLRYAEDTQSVDLQSRQKRSARERFFENTARLFGPLL